MIEIAVVSGKGGSGKTTLTSSFAMLLSEHGLSVVVADADVDTPSLHFLLRLTETSELSEVQLSKKASIDQARCLKCLDCVEACRFFAMNVRNGYPVVDKYLCEGCGTCRLLCPAGAIKIEEAVTGKLTVGQTAYGFPFVTAQLELGEHNSGRLVDMVRGKAQELALKSDADVILLDGAPGVGCPVISTLVGVDYAVIVTEPTPAAEAGALRVLELAEYFKVPTGFVVNKADISTYRGHVVRMLSNRGSEYLGDVPFDFVVVKALAEGKPPVTYPSRASSAIRKVFGRLAEVVGWR